MHCIFHNILFFPYSINFLEICQSTSTDRIYSVDVCLLWYDWVLIFMTTSLLIGIHIISTFDGTNNRVKTSLHFGHYYFIFIVPKLITFLLLHIRITLPAFVLSFYFHKKNILYLIHWFLNNNVNWFIHFSPIIFSLSSFRFKFSLKFILSIDV